MAAFVSFLEHPGKKKTQIIETGFKSPSSLIFGASDFMPAFVGTRTDNYDHDTQFSRLLFDIISDRWLFSG